MEGESTNIDVEPITESTGVHDIDDMPDTNIDADITPPPPPSSAPPLHSSPPASAMPAVYAGSHPMCLAPKQPTSIHMCCTRQVTLSEIEDGSTVVKCNRAGCETIWVCSLLQY